MDIEEAFSILGIPSDASTEEVSSKYRELAKQNHPDKGGDINKMKEIIEAYKLIIESSKSVSLTASELRNIIEVSNSRSNNSLEKKIQQIESHKNLVKQIINDNTRKNKHQKRLTLVLGSASTLFFYLMTQVNSLLEGTTNSTIESKIVQYQTLTPFLFIYGLCFGILYIAFSIRVTQVEHLIEDVNEMLGNKTEYYSILSKFNDICKQSFTEKELREIITETILSQDSNRALSESSLSKTTLIFERKISLESAIKEIGFTYFTRLFISKGLEIGILNENERIVEGKYLVHYSLAMKGN